MHALINPDGKLLSLNQRDKKPIIKTYFFLKVKYKRKTLYLTMGHE